MIRSLFPVIPPQPGRPMFFTQPPSYQYASKNELRVLLFVVLLWLSPGCVSQSGVSVGLAAPDRDRNECVVLIHGMGRTSGSFSAMQEKLQDQGYTTVNLDYPSTQKHIGRIADEDLPKAFDACEQFHPKKIHVVTHSLGGIIVRQLFTMAKPGNLGRVVMLSPPNEGSELVDRIKDWYLYYWLTGPAGQQLTTDADSVPNRLGGVDYSVGIITGKCHAFFDSWFTEIIPGENDGKVAVNRARLRGMEDFLVVQESHSFLMDSEYVQQETINFLQEGRFNHQRPQAGGEESAGLFTICPD